MTSGARGTAPCAGKEKSAVSATAKTADKFSLGGDEGDRTPDLLHAMQALSQLSYAPVMSAWCYPTKISIHQNRNERKQKSREGASGGKSTLSLPLLSGGVKRFLMY